MSKFHIIATQKNYFSLCKRTFKIDIVLVGNAGQSGHILKMMPTDSGVRGHRGMAVHKRTDFIPAT